MKYLRLIIWHILPTVTIFLVLLGIQLIPITAFGVILALFGPDETGSVSTREFVYAILLLVSNALSPSIGLFFLVPALDKSLRNKSVCLKIVLPFPFILVASLMTYVLFHIPVPEYGFTGWSVLVRHVTIILILLVAAFAPYWYILQTQRLVVWLLKRVVTTITRSREPPNPQS